MRGGQATGAKGLGWGEIVSRTTFSKLDGMVMVSKRNTGYLREGWGLQEEVGETREEKTRERRGRWREKRKMERIISCVVVIVCVEYRSAWW